MRLRREVKAKGRNHLFDLPAPGFGSSNFSAGWNHPFSTPSLPPQRVSISSDEEINPVDQPCLLQSLLGRGNVHKSEISFQ